MDSKRRGGSTAAKHFRRILYAAIGVVLSSYVVLFILVVSRHIDQSAREELKRSVAKDVEGKGPAGGIGPSLLGVERFHERWAAVARVLTTNEARLSRQRRRIHVCTPPRFRRPPGPVTALASFPGSGNTWIRFLVQQATGYLTGSVYRDFSLKRNGFPAESVANGSVLLVKTHEWGEATRSKFEKAVLLIRDPYGALVAEFNRRAGGHIGHASPDKFHKGNAWQSFVMIHAKLWMESILDWLHFSGPLLILHYEVITADLPGELIRLLKFLETNVSWNAFQCVIRNRDGIFRRAKKPLNFDPFEPSLRRVVNGYKAIVDAALVYHSRGIILDPRNETALQIAVSNSSLIPVSYTAHSIEREQSESPS